MPVDGDIVLKAGLDASGLTKSFNNLQKSISKGFSNIIRMGLGVRSMYALIRKLRKALFEGFENLAQVSDPFNASVSSMMNALAGLKSSFASAFAPIIQAVAPAITTFINLVSKAVDAVGKLIAALTGQKDYIKYIPTQQDYAQSVADTGKSADKTSKSLKKTKEEAKKLQRQLMKFDDVNILKKDKDNADDKDTTPTVNSGITKQSAIAGVENLSLDKTFTDLAEKIKEAWKKADLTEIGNIVGTKIRNALNNIPWNKIKEVLAKLGKSIATFLNGYLETPELYYTIGKTIAEGINSALTFVYSFVTNFNWASLGEAFKDKILGILQNIDWQLIFNTAIELGSGLGTAFQTAFNNTEMWRAIFSTLTNALTALVSAIHGFVESINWSFLGVNIGISLNDSIKNFKWGTISQTLISLINGAFNLWYYSITTFDFTKFGSYIGTTFSDTIKGINWEEGGASVAETINGLFEALDGFITETDWAALGQSVIDVIKGFFDNLDWSLYGKTFSDLIVGLFDALVTAIEDIDWDELPGKITTAIYDFFSNFEWNTITEKVGELLGAAFKALLDLAGSSSPLLLDLIQFGKDIINGCFSGILDALASVGIWISDNIVGPFIEGFKTAFGIHSPSTLMKPLGGDIILGLFRGILNIFKGIGNWIQTNLVDPFISEIKKLFGLEEGEPILFSVGKSVISGLMDGIADIMSGIVNWLQTTITDPIINGIKNLFGLDGEESTLFSVGKSIISGLKDGITNIMTDIVSWLQTTVTDPIVNGIKGLFGLDNGGESTLFGLGKSIISGLKDGIFNIMSGIVGWLQTIVTDPIINGIKSLFGLDNESESSLFSIGKSIISGVKNGIFNLMSGIVGWLQTTVTDPIVNGIKSLFGLDGEGEPVFISIGKNLLEGLKDGLLGAMDGISDWLDKYITGPICGFFEKLFGLGSPSVIFEDYGKNLLEGLKNGLLGAMDGVGTWIDENVTGPICGFFKNLFGIASPSTVFEGYGGYLMEGLETGITDNTDLPKDALKTARTDMKDMFGTLQELLSWSKVGSDVMKLGLLAGILLMKPSVLTAMTTLEKDMRQKFIDKYTSWKVVGSSIINSIKQGISEHTSSLTSSITTILNGMKNSVNNINWWNVGDNIATGIYNGLIFNANWLSTLAWNTAVDMYNSACRALGIASPSKKFAWVGEMITKGLGEGIIDNQDNATEAVDNLTTSITKKAESANPTINMGTVITDWITDLDNVLIAFSDRVIDRFDKLTNTLNNLASLSSYGFPDISQGKVIPASINVSSNSEDVLSNVNRSLEALTMNQITASDLHDMLVEMFNEYMNFGFYIGDEQIARHANAGNVRLNRRYHTTGI